MVTNFFFNNKDKILYPNALQQRYVRFLLVQIEREKKKNPDLEILNILMNIERKLSLLVSVNEPVVVEKEDEVEEEPIEIKEDMTPREEIIYKLKTLKRNIEKEIL